MIHLNAELWNIHKLCVLQVLNAEKANPVRKKGINWLRKKCRGITSIESSLAKSQQEMLCLNKVKAKLKVRS